MAGLPSTTRFNSLLEMHNGDRRRVCYWHTRRVSILYWRCTLSLADASPLRTSGFQFSIGDAGSHSVLSVWVFKFFVCVLARGVWLGCVGFRVLSVGKVCWVCRCVYLRVSSSRRRHAPRSCTTFYKLDLRFTKSTRRRSRTIRQR